MTNIGIIGASGFVGRHLTEELIRRQFGVRAIVRAPGSAPVDCEEVGLGDFTAEPNWDAALNGLDTVICLAARVHVMHETEADPLAAFRTINVDVTRAIAQASARVGVKRLVYVSSIKVNGEGTSPGMPYRASDPPEPADPYGISKFEAEVVLRKVSEETDLEVVIIRPPLVYGPGVGGNFRKLFKLASTHIPLPFGSVKNKRSMIAVENLVDAILHCATAIVTEATVVLVKDDETLSTPELLRQIGSASGRTPRIIPFPQVLLETGFKLIGKKAESERMIGSLEVEISSEPPGINWQPPFAADDCLKRTTQWFAQNGIEHK